MSNFFLKSKSITALTSGYFPIPMNNCPFYLLTMWKVELADSEEEEVIEVREVTKEGFDKATSAQFDLLRVLGQGSFGKVTEHCCLRFHMQNI